MKKIKLIILLVGIVYLNNHAFAQVVTNTKSLLKFSEEMAIESIEKRAHAEEYAKEHNLPVTFVNDKGVFFELQYISDESVPMYYKTDNSNAAKTVSTNKVYPGGGAGLSLDGTGITAREWDGGAVRATHQEFGNRVTQVDNPSSTHWHATHVAGTIMASGVKSTAKGMAYNANLRAFDWNADNSEMASEAALGALVSNHSYGFVRGWSWNGTWSWFGAPTISTLEDYKFGFYDINSRNWDQIAMDAPYYLIVKSAGNDRNEGPNSGQYPKDGPYDCIAHGGISKNVLTVGAVNDIPGGYNGPSSVSMSSFSSWGPADDGRVKPDIVTNGVNLYSCTDGSNSGYTSSSGTSMSSPSATGSLVLLQQHWENLVGTGNYMTAATLKGLVIHTADEAGSNDGPDYRFGWGLMNTENAALLISEDQNINVIDEIIISEQGSFEMIITSDGTEDIKVTICWTDVPGLIMAPQLDPIEPMLVNDLDLKVTFDGNTYYPWKLNRNSPTAAATNNSENNIDNIEVVFIKNPDAGEYTVIVDHDGYLEGGTQAFSIIVSGVTNTVSLATVTAGADMESCMNSTVHLMGGSLSSSYVLWTTTGDGAFDDPNLPNANYTLGENDMIEKIVELKLTAYNIPPSQDSISDNMIITILDNPISNAGDDITICGSLYVQLDGQPENQVSVKWTSRGDGNFNDATLVDAIYTFGVGDIENGEVKLSLIAIANELCGDDDIDNINIYITEGPKPDAGFDGVICGANSYPLVGSAENYESCLWTTSGDGTFDDETSLSTSYLPGQNDIEVGIATLTLTAYYSTGCEMGYDDMEISILQLAVANAGPNDSVCDNGSYTLESEVQHQSVIEWTTDGDGTFVDASELNTDYIPGLIDGSNGDVTLHLNAHSMAPCDDIVTSDITLFVKYCSAIGENPYNNLGFTVVPNPANKQFLITASGITDDNIKVKIIGINGRSAFSKDYNVVGKDFSVTISSTELASGVYTIVVSTDSKVGTGRLIIQH